MRKMVNGNTFGVLCFGIRIRHVLAPYIPNAMSKEIGFKVGDKKSETTEEVTKPVTINPEEEIKKIVSVLLLRFVPASTIKESNIQMSTAEFADKIRSHYPGAAFVDDSFVYNMLIEQGFVYTIIGNDLQWLIKKV